FQKRLSGGALRVTLGAALATHRLEPFHMCLDNEVWLVFGAGLADLDIAQMLLPGRCPFLQGGLRVLTHALGVVEGIAPELRYERPRRLKPAIQIERRYDRLANIAKNGFLLPPSMRFLGRRKHDRLPQTRRACGAGARVLVHERVVARRQLAFPSSLMFGKQTLGDTEPQHTIAKKFEPIVIALLLLALMHAAVRDRLAQQGAVIKSVADALL